MATAISPGMVLSTTLCPLSHALHMSGDCYSYCQGLPLTADRQMLAFL